MKHSFAPLLAWALAAGVAACSLQVPVRHAQSSEDAPQDPEPAAREASDASGRAQVDDTALADPAAQLCGGFCPAHYVCLAGADGGKAECLPDGTLQCTVCSVDAHCAGGTCAKVGGEGPFCLIPCRVGAGGASNCPAGSACQSTEKGLRCVPATQSCTCTAATLKSSQACSVATGCAGQRVCGPAGWGECVASTKTSEVCDGVDNDCNGKTDDVAAPLVASNNSHCGVCGNACASNEECLAGVCTDPSTAQWSTLGGDQQHSGAKLGVSAKLPLSPAWSVQVDEAALQAVAADGALVFVTATGILQNAKLHAYNVTNGQLVWEHEFGKVFSVGQPTAVAGKVYVGQCNHSSDTHLWVLEAATGKVLHALPMQSQWDSFWAPLVVGDTVYAHGGLYGGLYAFSTSSEQQLFFVTLPQWSQWSPSLYDGTIFSFVGGSLSAHHPQTGKALWTTTVELDWTGYDVQGAAVFDGAQGYVVASPSVHAFSPKTGEILWSKSSQYAGMPAVAGSEVYALHAGQLQALAAQDGGLLWTYVGDNAAKYQPLVTKDHVFLSSPTHVAAVHRQTHQADAIVDGGGWLALAQGRLLVAGPKGKLTAWTFAP